MLQLLKNLINDIRKADLTDPLVIISLVGFLSVPVLVGILAYKTALKGDIRDSAVKITNRAKTHGGSGVVISSDANGSWILTNAHVCGVVKHGGLVSNAYGDFQAISYLESNRSDLCVINIGAQLGKPVKIAQDLPSMYDAALISGHPALMPTVVSTGHVSGRQIIQVMIGVRPCTEEEKHSAAGLACALLGGLPIVKNYESVLVTATIMPGSSGSGVYNAKDELIGLVFAGSQGFGYAWTVPYDQVINFLGIEAQQKAPTLINQEFDLLGGQEDQDRLRDMEKVCSSPAGSQEELKEYCDIFKRVRIF